MHIENKVNWTIEPHRCALLIDDMQTHYLSMVPNRGRAASLLPMLAE